MAFGWNPFVASTTENFLQVMGKGVNEAQLSDTAHKEST
jgi:hypothetical protein